MPLFARCSCLLVTATCVAGVAMAQAVISARAGVINYSEGSVLVDDRPLDQKFGTFPDIKQDSVLRTGKGRAEVLLTPGAFLRLDENSSIRMSSTALSDTRVEFLSGAVIIDTNNAAADTPIKLVYKTYTVRFPKPGVYRLDADPGVFETYTGEAQITGEGQPSKTIDESHQFFFGIGAETNKYGEGAIDNFSEWCRTRAETLEADQRAANQSTADPSADPSASPFGGVLPGPDPNALPSYGFPGTGSVSVAPLIIDNGLLGAYGPLYGPYYPSPPAIYFILPRGYGYRTGSPRYGTPPLRTGYPGYRSSYPRPTPWRPSPIPLGRTSAYYRPPAVHSYSAPAMRSTPIFHPAAPAAAHGIGAAHH